MNHQIYAPNQGHDFGHAPHDPMAELTALRDQSVAYDLQKHDHLLAVPEMRFDRDCRLHVGGGLAPVDLSDHASRQLYFKLGPGHFDDGTNKALPFDYLKAHTPLMRATLLNAHVDAPKLAERKWLVRCYEGQARAVVGGAYPCIANTAMLDTLLEGLQGNVPPGLRVVRPHLDPDRLILRLTWADTGRPDGGGGTYGVGVFMANNEIGLGHINIWPLVMRTSCSNSIIFKPVKTGKYVTLDDLGTNGEFDEENERRPEFRGLSLRHAGDAQTLALTVRTGIIEALGRGAEYVEKMVQAELRKLPSFGDVLNGLAEQFKWPDSTRTLVAVGTEGKDTLAGVVNGVTFAAQRLESPQEAAEMEALGGSILVEPDSFFGKAARQSQRVPVAVR